MYNECAVDCTFTIHLLYIVLYIVLYMKCT